MKYLPVVFIALLVFFGGEKMEKMDVVRYEFNTFRLDNKLKVIHIPVKNSGVVEIEVWFHAGSADESDKERGLAHVLEHMIFKGTERLKAQDFAGRVEGMGGYINAFTSNDNTVYHITIVKDRLEEAASLLSEVLSHPLIDPTELAKELDVILEEWRRGEDIPESKLYKEFFVHAYSKHPYRYPTIGIPETISSFKREDVINFYKKWYNSANTTLIIAGDISRKEAEIIAKRYFSQLPPPEDVKRTRVEEPEQRGLKTFVVEGNFVETRAMLGFHTVPLSHESTPVLELLSHVLTENYSSRLHQKLVVKKNIVRELFSYSYTPLDSGMFLIGFSAEDSNVKDAIEDICRELRILPVTLSIDEVEKAKVAVLKSYITLNQKVSSIAKEAGYFDAFTGSPENLNRYIEALKRVTKDDIIMVVDKYIKPENLTAGVLLERNNDVKINNDILKRWIYEGFSKGEAEVKMMNEVKEEKNLVDWKRIVLNNGVRLLVREMPDTGTVNISIMIKGGVLYENPQSVGISNFAARALIRGTENLSEVEIMRMLDEIGGVFSASAGKDHIKINFSFLKGFEDEGLMLLKELLLKPSFPEEEIQKVRKQILDDIRAREDYLPELVRDVFEETLYRYHPYRFNPLGTKDSIKHIKRADIVKFWKAVLNGNELVVGIVGDGVKEHESAFVLTFSEIPSFKTTLPSPPTFVGLSRVEEGFREFNRKQVHILLGFPTVSVNEPDNYPLLVLDGILSGQGGRVFQVLREEKHLAYALTSILKRSSQPGYIAIYLACEPSKYQEARIGIINVLRELIEKGVTDEETERAKNMLTGKFWIWLQTNGAKADFMVRNEFYRLEFTSFNDYTHRLKEISRKDVNRVIKKYINPEAYVITSVGSVK